MAILVVPLGPASNRVGPTIPVMNVEIRFADLDVIHIVPRMLIVCTPTRVPIVCAVDVLLVDVGNHVQMIQIV